MARTNINNILGSFFIRSTERPLELLLLMIQAMEILYKRQKLWLFVVLVLVLVLDFISIMKTCHRCLMLNVYGISFCIRMQTII
jgi:hypothetical protein